GAHGRVRRESSRRAGRAPSAASLRRASPCRRGRRSYSCLYRTPRLGLSQSRSGRGHLSQYAQDEHPTAFGISRSSRRTSMCLPPALFIRPAPAHSSISAFRSRVPAPSEDHVLIAEQGCEQTSTFLPRTPWASRTIRRFAMNTAKSRNALYATIDHAAGTSRAVTTCGAGQAPTPEEADGRARAPNP